MIRKIYTISFLIFIYIISPYNSYSQNTTENIQAKQSSKSSILLRPNTNIGFLGNEMIYSAGIRALLEAGENKSYGIEISRYDYFQNENPFYTIGIILEQKLFNWFNMSIGTIGYFNYGNDANNVVGLTSNLGWEPNSNKRFSPFITYRSDLIFAAKINNINSLNLGLNIKI